MNIEEAVQFLDELSNESIHSINEEVSVKPTIDIPLITDLNNNTLQEKSNNESLELVKIDVYRISSDESKEGESGLNLDNMSLLTTTEDDKELNSIFELSPSLLQISSNEEAVVGNADFSENEVQVCNTSFATGEENSVVESVNDSNDAEDVSDINFTGNENTSDTESYEYQTTGRSRKRKRNNTEWSRNIRKLRRQSGKEYKNQEGKVMRAREVKKKKDCSGLCKFKCAKMFSQAER